MASVDANLITTSPVGGSDVSTRSPVVDGNNSQLGGTGVIYRMRGFDQNVSVNDYVFWSSPTVDSGASNYTGSAGPVVDIVVHSRIGV